MTFLKYLAVLVIGVLVGAVGYAYFGNDAVGALQVAKTQAQVWAPGLRVGTTTDATMVGFHKTGNCTIWAPSVTFTASTTQLVECQSATNGSIGALSTGIQYGDFVSVSMPTSTSATVNGIEVNGCSASTTGASRTIQCRLSNQTGANFTWTASASSSWKYLIEGTR